MKNQYQSSAWEEKKHIRWHKCAKTPQSSFKADSNIQVKLFGLKIDIIFFYFFKTWEHESQNYVSALEYWSGLPHSVRPLFIPNVLFQPKNGHQGKLTFTFMHTPHYFISTPCTFVAPFTSLSNEWDTWVCTRRPLTSLPILLWVTTSAILPTCHRGLK